MDASVETVGGYSNANLSGAVDQGLRVGLDIDMIQDCRQFHSNLVCSARPLSHDHVLFPSPVTSHPYTYAHLPTSLSSLSTPSTAMSTSTSTPIPRPPSRSERLLRDTLRKDDTLRTYGAHSSRPRSASSNCDEDDEDDDFFQSAILFRCPSRRNSAASALGHGHPPGFYVPDENEHASYSRLLRSSSYSGSSRSGRSGCNSSPRPVYTQEKQEELSRHHDAAPHEAVLRSRLDSVIHSMRIDKDRDAVDVSLCVAVFESYSSLHDRH